MPDTDCDPTSVARVLACDAVKMSDSPQEPTRGQASVHVDASADEVFAYLTDIDRLPGLSPENQRCEWLAPSSEMAIGSRFRGHNKAGDYEWQADCEVTVLEAGSAFAYEVPPRFEFATTWRYDVEPDADGAGCTVTESFHAPLLEQPDIYPGKIEGRRDNLEKACEITMSNLAAAFD